MRTTWTKFNFDPPDHSCVPRMSAVPRMRGVKRGRGAVEQEDAVNAATSSGASPVASESLGVRDIARRPFATYTIVHRATLPHGGRASPRHGRVVALPRTEATKFAPRFIALADESTADDAIVAVGTALRIDDDAALSALQATEQHLRQTNSESDTAAPAYAVFATHTVAGVVLSLAFHEIGGALSRTRVSNLVEGLSALKTALAHLCSRPLALERAPALLPSAAAVGVWMHAFEAHTAAGRSSVRNQPDITLGRVWNYAPRSHSLWRAGRGAAHPAVGIGTPTRDPVHVRGALVVGSGDARVAAVSALLEVSNEHPPAWRSAPALADPSLAALPRIEATLVIAPAGALQRWCAFAATTRNVHVVARWADYERLQIEYLPTNEIGRAHV